MKSIATKCLPILVALITLGASASAPADTVNEEAKAYLDRAIVLLQEKHINSDTADWPTLKANAHAQIEGAKTAADVYPAIRGILTALNQKHSFLLPPQTSSAPPPSSGKTTATSTPARPMPHGRIVSRRIGYVWLPELNTRGAEGQAAGSVYRQSLVTLLTSLDDQATCGWILDLRDNAGGNMWPMLNGLDPLLGVAPFGFFVAKGGRTVPWIRTAYGIAPVADGAAAVMKPSFELKHARAPVAVLIGPKTSSTGEMVALAMIGRADVRTFGTPTYGFTTANGSYPLSDGALLVITETTVRDRTGKDYFGPISPDSAVPLEEAEKHAVGWLESRCAAAR